MPLVDASTAVMADPVVPEDKRFCSACGTKVGRSTGDKPGRTTGFCPKCRQAFSFDPKLKKGDLASEAERLAEGSGWLPAMLCVREVAPRRPRVDLPY